MRDQYTRLHKSLDMSPSAPVSAELYRELYLIQLSVVSVLSHHGLRSSLGGVEFGRSASWTPDPPGPGGGHLFQSSDTAHYYERGKCRTRPICVIKSRSE
jgi:hypothetical protein